jgi:hypothetical protein
MPDSLHKSRGCATALLDAYCKDDAPQMSRIAVEAQAMSTRHSSDARESECLEVLGGIAAELLRANPGSDAADIDPYVSLLLHLAHPDLIDSVFEYHN